MDGNLIYSSPVTSFRKARPDLHLCSDNGRHVGGGDEVFTASLVIFANRYRPG